MALKPLLPPDVTINLLALNPPTDTAGRTHQAPALNRSRSAKTTIDFVALNPQPLPPGGTLDFVAVATWPAD